MTGLAGKVAVVTGASRGVGKGIAIGLGEAGATVYVTGRTRRGEPGAADLGGTVDETADEVTAAGGTGIALACDHRDDEQVRAVFERIASDHGRIDVLVNNVWGGYELLHAGGYEEYVKPFWEQPATAWDDMFGPGVRAHYVASVHAAKTMVAHRRGLIVFVSSHGGERYEGNVAYGVAKAATDRLAADTATQLRDHGVATVSLYPGLVRTEGVMRWAQFFDLSNSESPQFVGRAVAALAADPRVLEKTGTVVKSGELAEEYGFTDVDGRRPLVAD